MCTSMYSNALHSLEFTHDAGYKLESVVKYQWKALLLNWRFTFVYFCSDVVFLIFFPGKDPLFKWKMERPPSIMIRTCTELLHTGDTCRSSQQLVWHKCQKNNWSGSIKHLQTAMRRPRPVLVDSFTFEFYELCNKIWSLTWFYMWNLYAEAFCLTLSLQTHPEVSSIFLYLINCLKRKCCLYLQL